MQKKHVLDTWAERLSKKEKERKKTNKKEKCCWSLRGMLPPCHVPKTGGIAFLRHFRVGTTLGSRRRLFQCSNGKAQQTKVKQHVAGREKVVAGVCVHKARFPRKEELQNV